jgi:hypothetical protein
LGGYVLRKAFIIALICIIVSPEVAYSQTRRRSAPKRSASAAKAAAEKKAAEINAAASRVSAQIKTLTQFLYLFGGIAKGLESTDQAARTGDISTVAIEQNERNKAKIRESIRNVREGLDKLEADFRFNPNLKSYYTYLSGVARTGETAESQAAANRFDEAGKSLLKVVGQLADTLAAMR